jgi:hypothetical protein
MTIIAWDGAVLAADKMAVDSCGMQRTTTKIELCERPIIETQSTVLITYALIGATGSQVVSEAMKAWFKNGQILNDFPAGARDDKATLIAITHDSVRFWSTEAYPCFITEKFMAWGTGRDFALAAMYLGKSAVEAVEIACHFQTDCGNGIDVLML